ncbi:MAG: flavodoxin family protein [Candidatus Freyarchaeota archaeon]
MVVKILAFQGSPRMEKGNTEKILSAFLEGAREAGAETETLYLRRMNINPCQGCFSCWFQTPGECVQKDDMKEVLEKILEADVLVWATPLYIYNMTAYMKAMFERILPLIKPDIIQGKDGIASHPPRYRMKRQRWILISNAGFPEQEHFEPLLHVFDRISRLWTGGEGFALTILKGAGEMLRLSELFGEDKAFEPFFRAVRDAGREFVEKGTVSKETKARVDKPLWEYAPELAYATRESFKSR